MFVIGARLVEEFNRLVHGHVQHVADGAVTEGHIKRIAREALAMARSREYDICLILFIVRLILDYGAVWYYSKDTYFFLMLFWVLAQKLLQERRTAVVSA